MRNQNPSGFTQIFYQVDENSSLIFILFSPSPRANTAPWFWYQILLRLPNGAYRSFNDVSFINSRNDSGDIIISYLTVHDWSISIPLRIFLNSIFIVIIGCDRDDFFTIQFLSLATLEWLESLDFQCLLDSMSNRFNFKYLECEFLIY